MKTLSFRLAAIITCVLIFIWLPAEDASQAWAIVLALGTASLSGAYFLFSRNRTRRSWQSYLMVGFLAGLAVTPLALLLMAIKSSLHGHSEAEYSAQQVIQVLRSTPIWVIAGLLLSAGVAVALQRR